MSVDEPDTSSVTAHWEDDTLSAAINTSSEVYVIEVSTYRLAVYVDCFSYIALKLTIFK